MNEDQRKLIQSLIYPSVFVIVLWLVKLFEVTFKIDLAQYGLQPLHLKGLPGIKDYRYQLVTLKTVEEIDAVLDEIVIKYAGYEFEKTPIELINYHEKCPV